MEPPKSLIVKELEVNDGKQKVLSSSANWTVLCLAMDSRWPWRRSQWSCGGRQLGKEIKGFGSWNCLVIRGKWHVFGASQLGLYWHCFFFFFFFLMICHFIIGRQKKLLQSTCINLALVCLSPNSLKNWKTKKKSPFASFSVGWLPKMVFRVSFTHIGIKYDWPPNFYSD